MDIKIEKLKNSEIEIIGSISFEELNKNREKAVKKLSANIKIDGFREGKVPEKILIEKVGEMMILNEMAEIALQEAYPNIIIENKIDPITAPQITITKLAPNNPMEFTIKTSVMPEIKLPDYKDLAKKEISKKEESIEVTDKELEETIEQIRKSRQTPHSCSDEKCEHEEKADLPELNDEFVKGMGDFKDVADFKVKLKENMKQEKTQRQKEKKRLSILESIIKKTNVEIPEILIEGELRKMLAEMSDNISKMGLKFDKYLEHIKKTEDDLKKEWRPDAENRVKGQLVLNKISIEEKITPPEDEVKKSVDHLMSHHKEAKRENVEIYVKMMITNEEVFKFLENQG